MPKQLDTKEPNAKANEQQQMDNNTRISESTSSVLQAHVLLLTQLNSICVLAVSMNLSQHREVGLV